jgi:hypothetical protein
MGLRFVWSGIVDLPFHILHPALFGEPDSAALPWALRPSGKAHKGLPNRVAENLSTKALFERRDEALNRQKAT